MIGEAFARTLTDARHADNRAWELIYRDLARPLAGYFATHRVRDVDNLVGETFLHVAKSLGQFTGNESQFRSWVFTIAHRRMIDSVRRDTKRPQVSLEPAVLLALADASQRGENEVDHLVEQLYANGQIAALLAELTTEQAEVLVLRFGADLDATTVGELTNRSTNAVAALTARALTRLRELLDASPVDPFAR